MRMKPNWSYKSWDISFCHNENKMQESTETNPKIKYKLADTIFT